MFLCHFPSSAGAEAWGLPSALSGGARTFLPPKVLLQVPWNGGPPVCPALSGGRVAQGFGGVKVGEFALTPDPSPWGRGELLLGAVCLGGDFRIPAFAGMTVGEAGVTEGKGE